MNDFMISDIPEVFSDLTPISQGDDDGPNGGVCRIDYPVPFKLAFDYFRAIIRKVEYSPRALRLTTLCLEQNPANYTVWHYRRLCMYSMREEEQDCWKEGLEKELSWVASLGGDNPKNYQIWYHRRALLEKFRSSTARGEEAPSSSDTTDPLSSSSSSAAVQQYGKSELEYISSVLEADGKNYHAWSHRQWVVGNILASSGSSSTVWQGEMDYAASLLEDDVRNNSAWNHRWFALHGQGAADGEKKKAPLSLNAARQELDFTMTKARLDPYNESPFRYLLALLKEQLQTLQDAAQITSLLSEYQEKIQSLEQVLVDANRDAKSSRHISSTLVDLLEWKGDAASLDQAAALLQELADEQDPIRAKYWNLRRQQIEQQKQQAA